MSTWIYCRGICLLRLHGCVRVRVSIPAKREIITQAGHKLCVSHIHRIFYWKASKSRYKEELPDCLSPKWKFPLFFGNIMSMASQATSWQRSKVVLKGQKSISSFELPRSLQTTSRWKTILRYSYVFILACLPRRAISRPTRFPGTTLNPGKFSRTAGVQWRLFHEIINQIKETVRVRFTIRSLRTRLSYCGISSAAATLGVPCVIRIT